MAQRLAQLVARAQGLIVGGAIQELAYGEQPGAGNYGGLHQDDPV